MLYDTYKKFPREVRINEKQLNKLLIHEKLHYNYDIEPLQNNSEKGTKSLVSYMNR